MSVDEYDLRSAQQRRSHVVIYEAGITQVHESYEWGKDSKMTIKVSDSPNLPPPSPSNRGTRGVVRWSQLPSSIDRESLLITYVDHKSADLKRASWRPNEQRCKALIDPLEEGTWVGEQVQAAVGPQNTMVSGILLVSDKDHIVLLNEKNGRMVIRHPNVVMRIEDKSLPTKCVKQFANGQDTVGIMAVVPNNLKRLQLTYLASHIQWKAKYILVVASNFKTVYMMNATACITNKTPNTLTNLSISLVSGQVRTERDYDSSYSSRKMMVAQSAAAPESLAFASSPSTSLSSTNVSGGNDRFDLKINYEIPARETIETDFIDAPKGTGLAQPWFRYSVSEGSTSRTVAGIPYGVRVWTQTGDYSKFPSLPGGTWYVYSAAYGGSPSSLPSRTDEKSVVVAAANVATTTTTIIGAGDFLGSSVLPRQSHSHGYVDVPVGSTNHFLGGHNLQVQLTHQSADYVDTFNRNRTVAIHASFTNQFDTKKIEASGQPPFDLRDYVVEMRYDTRGQKVELMQAQGRVKSSATNTYMKTLYPPPINKETRLQEPVSLFGTISMVDQATNPDVGFIRNKGIENGQLRIWIGPIPEGETVELSLYLNVLPEQASSKR